LYFFFHNKGWVQIFEVALGWIGLGHGSGWVGSQKMDPRTTLIHAIVTWSLVGGDLPRIHSSSSSTSRCASWKLRYRSRITCCKPLNRISLTQEFTAWPIVLFLPYNRLLPAYRKVTLDVNVYWQPFYYYAHIFLGYLICTLQVFAKHIRFVCTHPKLRSASHIERVDAF